MSTGLIQRSLFLPCYSTFRRNRHSIWIMPEDRRRERRSKRCWKERINPSENTSRYRMFLWLSVGAVGGFLLLYGTIKVVIVLYERDCSPHQSILQLDRARAVVGH